MKRCTTILILFVALLSACSSPRKACRKADKLLARAVWKCPDILHQDSATYTRPPDTLRARIAMADSINYDSLLAACATLNLALRSELVQHTVLPAMAPASAVRSTKPAPNAVQRATERIRNAACNWQDFTEDFGRISVVVRNSGRGPLLTVIDKGESVKVPCPPAVNNVVITGVATWYRTFFWAFVVCAALFLLGLVLFIAHHHAG
jgi:hypothetical protein